MRIRTCVLLVVLSLLIVPFPSAGSEGDPASVEDAGLQEVGYDPETGETVYAPLSASFADDLQSTAGFSPDDDDDDAEPETVIGPDGRTRVSPTTSFPWRAVVKIYFSKPNGDSAMCSGAMVSQRHVLTAGHCMHAGDGSSWYDTFRVLPGMDDGWSTSSYLDRPLGNNDYGAAKVTYMRTYTGWTQNGDWNHDWGLLTLDRNIGSHTGWFGYFTADPSHSWYTGTQNTAGYPADLDNGRNMYFDADTGCSTNTYKHWYNMDTSGGQSGSGVWVYSSGSRYIGTVHAYGGDGSTCSNSGTRLDSSKYNSLQSWISSDGSATDKAELFERIKDSSRLSSPVQDGTSFSPQLIGPGGTLNVRLPVRNGGTASTGTYHIAFYASTDTTISSSDTLIGEVAVSQGALSTLDLQSGLSMPHLSDGDYYVGWIIDNRFEVAEYDGHSTTNVGHKIGETLTVDSRAPTGSLAVQPVVAGQHVVSWVARDSGSGNALIELQRQNILDGDWQTVCTQPSAGAETTPGSCFSDEPSPGRYCFRLQMTDRAGNTGHSLQQCTTVVL